MRNYPYFVTDIFDHMIHGYWSDGDMRDDLLFSPPIDVAILGIKLSTGKSSSSDIYKKADRRPNKKHIQYTTNTHCKIYILLVGIRKNYRTLAFFFN